jgi:hypothetical protein
MVTAEPSHDPLGCAISSVVDEEDDGVEGGEEARGVDERPPVAPEWLRSRGVSKEQLRRVRVRVFAGARWWNRATRGGAKGERKLRVEKSKEEEEVCERGASVPPHTLFKEGCKWGTWGSWAATQD